METAILFYIVLTGAVPLRPKDLRSRFLTHIAGKLVVAVVKELSQAYGPHVLIHFHGLLRLPQTMVAEFQETRQKPCGLF